MSVKNRKVLVIGAGVGGIKAALDLAESGLKVYLCDRSPVIGGTSVQMDKWFPDGHCGMCQMLPTLGRDEFAQFCLRTGLTHPNIEFLPLTEVEKVVGEAGDFSVTLRRKSPGVRHDLCTGCGLCTQVCPVEVANELNQGLDKRKAIYIRHPLITDNAYTIDWENCTKCRACVEECPTHAISFGEPDETREIEVGAVVLSTGFEEFDPHLATQYGYQRYPNVITSIEMERMLSPNGPSQGELLRPSDSKPPRSIAFLLCVGSREVNRDYCSSACCMYAIKEAILAKQANPDIDVSIFFMDMRTFGKGHYRYYLEAKEKYGVNFIRCRVPVVKEEPQTRNLLVDAKSEDGSLVRLRFELGVLAIGQAPPPRFAELCRTLGVELNKWGFCRTREFSSVETSRKGVYVCGSASSPKDIADTLIEAGAAACQVSKLLSPFRGWPVSVPSCAGELAEGEARTAIFICRCGGEISGVVDISELVKFSKELPGVVHVAEVPYLCQRDTLAELRKKVEESKANRVVFAACTPSIYGRLLTEAMGEAGLSQFFVQLVNLREGVAWVHMGQPEAATEKAKSLVAMAVERAKLQQGLASFPSTVKRGALVIGGGLAGLVSVLSIAEQGYEVHLVERSATLGGNLRDIYSTLEGNDPRMLLGDIIQAVETSSLVHVYKETEVVQAEGYAGNFEITLKSRDQVIPLQVGAVIVATGGREYHPTEHLYGQSDRIVTQRELEEGLASGELDMEGLRLVVMIQCVGSRDEGRPYCSRICCNQALKNALKLKQLNPETHVFILYRDLMSYGFMEEYYTQAREAGVIFVRYEVGEPPQVKLDQGVLKVEVTEPALRGKLVLESDLVVLSPAIIPEDSNKELAQMLGLELTDDGFFKEVEVKFRPVDFAKDGVFACGLALSPRGIEEVIAQAQAAAHRVITLLSKEQLQPSLMIAEVNERWCTGCEVCIPVCPYGVRIKDGDKGVVVVREALCHGCGACAAACPSGAAKLRGFTDKLVFSMIDVAV
ncbi:FAD-dependent oxidoreductase [Chloroflexota bacterium]